MFKKIIDKIKFKILKYKILWEYNQILELKYKQQTKLDEISQKTNKIDKWNEFFDKKFDVKEITLIDNYQDSQIIFVKDKFYFTQNVEYKGDYKWKSHELCLIIPNIDIIPELILNRYCKFNKIDRPEIGDFLIVPMTKKWVKNYKKKKFGDIISVDEIMGAF